MSSRHVAGATVVDGSITVPGDKSISHRALILGALIRGRSYVGNLSPAADVAATAAVLRACGGAVRPFDDGRVSLDGAGPGRSLRSPDGTLDCANSGTTMRLMAGVLSGHDLKATLDGDASLRRRPMERVAAPLRAMGAGVSTQDGCAPVRIAGTAQLRGVEHRLEVASAQVKSAILLAGLSADGPTVVHEPLPTRDHTERLLRACGADLAADGASITLRPGPLDPFGLAVPGDISSAAFFLALAAARPGWRVRCHGVGLNAGRTGILDVLIAMGAEVEVEDGPMAAEVEPQGNLTVTGAPLHGVTVDPSLVPRCVDELPAIAVVATQAEGRTEIRGAAELRHKESDRIGALVTGLRDLGATVDELPDGLVIDGPVRLRPARLDAAGDHRLAMAWTVAAALVAPDDGESVIEGADSVAVSYPGFFDDLARLLSGPR
ncbi:MAG: 3-phosphoshikimate 1-carboxyvinyltransferase [Candidatus Dormibacteraeota bacterium]|uniref:3-phosphoshikimate 1-carboxyvinyltransferase n=1 Tax=Candidatus Amunia macphersoniae TaxID=3127014 RepID=A0A934KNG2_9BACT|nr:3-phosphoshikimate 1-carboxyvinyltransferase [Candidatus Dormibacteraeota bacterium]